MKKLLPVLLLPIFGCGTCNDLTRNIDRTCKKAKQGEPLPACPELEGCRKLRRQVYANASRIQISLSSALAFEGVDDAKAKQIYERALKAFTELMALMAKHKLVLEGVPL